LLFEDITNYMLSAYCVGVEFVISWWHQLLFVCCDCNSPFCSRPSRTYVIKQQLICCSYLKK